MVADPSILYSEISCCGSGSCSTKQRDRSVVEDKLLLLLKTPLYSNCINSLNIVFALPKLQELIDQVVEIILSRAQLKRSTFTIELSSSGRGLLYWCVDCDPTQFAFSVNL